MDHYINTSNHLSVVVTHEHQYYTSTASVYPTLPVTGDNEDHSWFAVVNFDSTIKPTLLNQFKIGLQHPDLLQDSGVLAYPQVYPKQNGQVYIPGFTSFTSPIPGSIESELIDPVYTLGDSMSWTRGRHSIKFGFQVDYTATNSYNINNNVTPAVTLGAGSVAVSGVNTLPGLVSANDTLAQEISPISPARFRRSPKVLASPTVKTRSGSCTPRARPLSSVTQTATSGTISRRPRTSR